jgi:aminoglycoside phosphotransferase (APT) family kinase protein
MTHRFTATQLAAINAKITDRRHVFYWQTDRAITPEDTGNIWKDRHGYTTDDELKEAANKLLDDPIVKVHPLDPAAQTSLGNINSVRSAVCQSGREVILRSHPRGIANGYFYVESLAAGLAIDAGLPAYHTLAIHDAADTNDFAFQILEKLPGTALVHWLQSHPTDEPDLLVEVGKSMARIHQIAVDGFGPFSNDLAKQGKLQGLHDSFGSAVRAGLGFNLEVLCDRDILTEAQATKVDALLDGGNPLLACDSPVLIHNDFADWNILTDGTTITGMLDWDECVGGDPVAEIACWSTFFDPTRLDGMLRGYWQVADKPKNFDKKFELLRLRYTISKMTLRVRRYEWEPTDAIRSRIEVGKTHLAASMNYFGIK